VGSKGTLVTVLHAELHLVPVPAAHAMVVLGYPDIAAQIEQGDTPDAPRPTLLSCLPAVCADNSSETARSA